MRISGKDLLSGISSLDLGALIDENPYLRGYLQGYLAEMHLVKTLRETPGVESVEKVPDSKDGHGDLRVVYKGVEVVIEAKSISSHGKKINPLTEEVQGKVCNKRTSRKKMITAQGSSFSTHYQDHHFDGLAISTFSLTGKWDFVYINSLFIPRCDSNDSLMKTSFYVGMLDTPGITSDVSLFLERITRLKSSHGRHPDH